MSATPKDPVPNAAPWPASDEVVSDALRGRILHGVYVITRALPGRAQLAAELGLPDEAIATALQILRDEGTVCDVPGLGTFVARLPRLESPDAAAERVETILRARLEHGVYPVGTWFPAQNKLLDEFGITLYVLLNVITKLVDRGLLSTVTSRGRIVLEPGAAAPRVEANEQAARAELERYVREGIEKGTFPLNSQIPSKQSLGAKFGLTAYQAGLALKPLFDEGLLTSPGSRGTYVADPSQTES
ncbi:GntR family transcriptional regulator [Streptomyces sp. SP17KL33]|uniref:GntR family transcriptional regulator n=1 Tax=Streptomyces sp. SP17KL33 TaxID=3002534 RepID=UPI002E7608D0|nr:GntR family transcriptional regulator [Streptomyces sp. SP17KL33]MEE1838108.1 GntR family transcriptional regulator [Streptomyces sp. SP17KL33]